MERKLYNTGVLHLAKAKYHLKEGQTILYPTDTVWGIGCDATNENAVKNVFKIKKRAESKSLVILVSSLEMLQQIIRHIPKVALDFLEQSNRPTTIIYDNPKGLAQNVVAKDNTVGIRMVQDDFCKELIHRFGKPIVSTSANISGEPTPSSFEEISSRIKKQVDFIVPDTTQMIGKKSSRIIKFSADGAAIYIRK